MISWVIPLLQNTAKRNLHLNFHFYFNYVNENTIELFQLLYANEECTENFLPYKGLSLILKVKAEDRTRNGEK